MKTCRNAASNAVGAYYDWEQSNSKLTTELTEAAVNRITLSTQENNPQNIQTKLEELAKKLKSRIQRVETNKLLPTDVPMTPQQFTNFKALHSKVEEELRNCQSAMTMSETQSKKLSPTEENAHKMMLFNDALKRQEDILKKEGEAQKDASKVVGMELHAVSSNPVLDGTLEHTNWETAKKTVFKIGAKVKDGMIDLSDKAFEDVVSYIVITTDPSVFLAKHNDKKVMLIAPWSLIHDNLKTSTAPFEPIMANWDKTKAPIGIFWRDGSDIHADIDHMTYTTHKGMLELNGQDLWSLYLESKRRDGSNRQMQRHTVQRSNGVRSFSEFTLHFELK